MDRRITGKRKQTYIHSSLYEELAGILPVIAPGFSVPMFVNNVLADHLEKYRDVMNEMYRKEVEKGCRNGRNDLSVGASGLHILPVI